MTKIPSLKEHKGAYEKIFQGQTLRESDKHYRWVLAQCLKAEPRAEKLLDIGCGGGYFLHWAEGIFDQCFGLDLAEKALQKAKLNTTRSHLVCAAGENLPFPDNCFDLLVNLGSLEHFLDLPQAVKEMWRVMKKGGWAAVLVPNAFFLPIILNVLLKGRRGTSSLQPQERQATREEWRELFISQGFKVEKILAYNYRSRQAPWVYRLLRPFIPFNLAYCFLFLARKE